MRPELKEAFFKQQIRRTIRKAVKQRLLNEQPVGLYATFVQPFTDVLQAVNLATQDILSANVMMAKVLWHIDPAKVEKAIADHDARSEKIAAKWAPLMGRIDTNLSSGDADFLALMFAPGLFAVSELGAKGYDVAEGMGSFFTNSGLRGLVPGLPSIEDQVPEPAETKGKSLLDKLNYLFLGAVAIGAAQKAFKGKKEEAKHSGSPVLLEQDDDKSGKASDKQFAEDFNQYLIDVGAQDELDKTRDELVKNLKETVKSLDKEYEIRKAAIDELMAAQDFDQFTQALETVKTASEQLASSDLAETRKSSKSLIFEVIEGIDDMKKDLEDGVNKLIKSEEFIEQTKETSGKEEVS